MRSPHRHKSTTSARFRTPDGARRENVRSSESTSVRVSGSGGRRALTAGTVTAGPARPKGKGRSMKRDPIEGLDARAENGAVTISSTSAIDGVTIERHLSPQNARRLIYRIAAATVAAAELEHAARPVLKLEEERQPRGPAAA
jgi:hypothetical protein